MCDNGRMAHHTNSSRPHRLLVGLLAISLLAACGGSGDTKPSATDPAHATTTITTPPNSAPPTTATRRIGDATIASIKQMLAASLTDVAWDCCGAKGAPTGAAIAIRMPGADDVLISTGSELGGAPFDPKAPFLASNLGRSLVQSVAYRLVDSGVLDPTATIEAWAPRMPGAKTVTVQMLLDGTTGWGDFKTAINDNVLPDLSRVWTLGEVVDVAARLGTTGGTGREIDTTVLGYILEKTTGSSIADLVRKHVTMPLGLNRTTIDVAAPKQPGYQHGVFVLNGAVLDTASVPSDAYWSFLGAAGSATSTLPDLLDLLDAWVTGELLGTNRAATPDKFRPDNAHPEAPTTIIGQGIPVDGYCDPRTGTELKHPCTPGKRGLDVMAIGRQPNGVGTTLFLWYFPDTGISIAMHHNSEEWVSRAPLADLAIKIHDSVAASS